jgi:hypothetical protein
MDSGELTMDSERAIAFAGCQLSAVNYPLPAQLFFDLGFPDFVAEVFEVEAVGGEFFF